jgi:MFS transporter, AAHS family, 4-hydroxybenzoate transporter
MSSEDRPSTELHWFRRGLWITALCFVINMADGLNIFVVTYLTPQMLAYFKVGADAFAWVFSSGLLGMGLGGLFIAPLADRVGKRAVITLSVALMSLGTLACSVSHSLVELCVDRLLVGLGIGAILASITAVSSNAAPPQYQRMAAGLPQAGYPIGATLAGIIIVVWLPDWEWQRVFGAAGLITLALVPVCWWSLRALPNEQRPERGLGHTIGSICKRDSYLLWVCTVCGFMALYFIGSWITKLAVNAGLPSNQAILATAIYSLGSFVGTVAVSYLTLKINLSKLVSTSLFAAAIALVVFGAFRWSLNQTLLLSFLIGLTLQGGVNANYSIASAIYPADIRATGIGWAMAIGRIGAFLGPLMGGALLAMGFSVAALFGLFAIPLIINGVAARLIAGIQET